MSNIEKRQPAVIKRAGNRGGQSTKTTQHLTVFGESESGKSSLLRAFYAHSKAAAQGGNGFLHYSFEVADPAVAALLERTQQHSPAGAARYEAPPASAQRVAPAPPETQAPQPTAAQQPATAQQPAPAPLQSATQPTEYGFTYRFLTQLQADTKPSAVALNLVWHDYPGSWFSAAGTHAQQQLHSFQGLFSSDVALLLVDGAKLRDNAGQEDRYLKPLFQNLTESLTRLQSELFPRGKKTNSFPRTWVIALTKADLLPGTDVFDFTNTVKQHAAAELEGLQQTIAGFVNAPEATSIGEHFLIFSAAPGSTAPGSAGAGGSTPGSAPAGAPGNTISGVELLLPLACLVPLQNQVKWAKRSANFKKTLELAAKNSGTILQVLGPIVSKLPVPPLLTPIKKLLGSIVLKKIGDAIADKPLKSLQDSRAQSLAHHDYLRAAVSEFQIRLQLATVEYRYLNLGGGGGSASKQLAKKRLKQPVKPGKQVSVGGLISAPIKAIKRTRG